MNAYMTQNKILKIENTWIPLSDGCRLAARIWMPENATTTPVPAILKYLPYRKRDETTERDALTHPYMAARALEGKNQIFQKSWDLKIPRNFI